MRVYLMDVRSKLRRALRPIGIVIGILAIAVLLMRCGLDWTANAILANAVRSDDREMPPTAFAIRASSADILALGGQGQGLNCSLPPGMDWLAFPRDTSQAPISLQMRQACAFHDYCYRHGQATYGYSQADCDYRLQEQAFRLCRFINGQHSVARCETDARKVTLGVRIGGAGSYKRATAMDDAQASSFFEFDPYPTRSPRYTAVRVSSAPATWLRQGALPQAAYFFDIRPSGTLLRVVGWGAHGEVMSTGLHVPARFDALNTAPMVLRDGPTGEDWFVWWQRRDLQSTVGRFAALAPARAARSDWLLLASESGYASAGGCYTTVTAAESVAAAPAALICPKDGLEFSELHPMPDTASDGVLRLVGQSIHRCQETDHSTCLVDGRIDTTHRSARVINYRARVDCKRGDAARTCDRYRSFVSAPYVDSTGDVSRAAWLVRGTANGEGYRKAATLRRYERGATEQDTAHDIGPLNFSHFPETYEPAALVWFDAREQGLLTLLGGSASEDLARAIITLPGRRSADKKLRFEECFRELDTSWLWRPPVLIGQGAGGLPLRIVFTKVQHAAQDFSAIAPAELDLGVTLQIRDVTLQGKQCVLGRVQSLSGLFAMPRQDEAKLRQAVRLRATGCAQRTRRQTQACRLFQATEAARRYGGFLAATRGAPMVASDFTGDGRVDLLFADVHEPTRSVLLRGTANQFELVASDSNSALPAVPDRGAAVNADSAAQ